MPSSTKSNVTVSPKELVANVETEGVELMSLPKLYRTNCEAVLLIVNTKKLEPDFRTFKPDPLASAAPIFPKFVIVGLLSKLVSKSSLASALFEFKSTNP